MSVIGRILGQKIVGCGDSFLSQLSVCFVVPQVNKTYKGALKAMASIRKRGSNSYLIVVSRGYDYEGNRLKSVQKTVKPPKEYTPKQAEKWVKDQAILFEREVQHTPEPINRSITLAKYIEHWAADIGPKKLADSTYQRDLQDVRCILPTLGNYKLTNLRKEVIRNFYEEMRHLHRFLLNSFLKQSMMITIPIQRSMTSAEKTHFDTAFRVELYRLESFSGAVCHKRNIMLFGHRVLHG